MSSWHRVKCSAYGEVCDVNVECVHVYIYTKFNDVECPIIVNVCTTFAL